MQDTFRKAIYSEWHKTKSEESKWSSRIAFLKKGKKK